MKKVCHLCLIVCIFLASLFFLFPYNVAAIGETTIVQITGPAQPPGFTPALLTIHEYDTVIFVNKSSTAYALTAPDGSFSSPTIPIGQQWRVTFGSLGAHEYHANESPQHMVGEILVVANTITLLPTPIPQVEATALAIIKAGKHPPDTIVLPTTQEPSPKHRTNIQHANMFLSPLVLSIAGGILLLLILIFMSVVLLRRHRKRQREEEEMDTLVEEIVPKLIAQKALPTTTNRPKKRRPLLAGLRRRHTDEDDDMDEDEDEV